MIFWSSDVDLEVLLSHVRLSIEHKLFVAGASRPGRLQLLLTT